MKRISFIAAALLSFHVSGSFNDDLMPHPDFHPVVIDGEITAAKDWAIVDYGRDACLKEPEYLDGRRCLKLKFEKPGTMTIGFSGKEKCRWDFSFRTGTPDGRFRDDGFHGSDVCAEAASLGRLVFL